MKTENNNEKSNLKFKNLILFLIYAVVTFVITIIFHEKWRDEAQAWLIARDLDFLGIIKQMVYEGHPPLWHFILAPFAKLGFPYITESIISWLIMCIVVWLVLNKAPFKKPIQILIIFTAPFIYLYPVIARSYCLIPLAVVLIAMLYKDRHEKPIKYTLSILLLAYTHLLMWGMVGILYLFFFLEEIFYKKKSKKEIKKLIISLVIAVFGLLALFFMLVGGTSTNTELRLNSILNITFLRINNLIDLSLFNIFGTIAFSLGFKVSIVAFCIILLIYGWKKSPQLSVITIVSILWQFFIYLCIYGESAQKLNLILLIFIFIAWLYKLEINKEDKLDKIVVFGSIFILLLSVMQGICLIEEEITEKYSYSAEVAEYINENVEEDAVIVSVFGPFTSAVIPYTNNVRYWNPSTEQYFTYMTWDKLSNEQLSLQEIMQNIKNNFKNEKLYLLDSNNILKEKNNQYLLELQNQNVISQNLYESNDNSIIYEEIYSLYRINSY